MQRDIQALVAEHTRNILLRISERTVYPATLSGNAAGQRVQDAPKALLDIADTEVLPGGSLIAAHESENTIVGWSIFVRSDSHIEHDSVEFILRGSVSTILDPQHFVSAAYRAILDRTVDTDGEALYSELIISEKLTRLEVLRILASSEEFQDRRERLLIVPVSTKTTQGRHMGGGSDRIFVAASLFSK
jgi:hypothetical protein